MQIHCCFLSGILLASLASAQHGELPEVEVHFPTDRQVVEIPFHFDLNKIIVDIEINGTGPYSFVLDSGAGSSYFLNGEKAKGMNLEVVGKAGIGGAGGGGPRMVDLMSGVTFGFGGIEMVGNVMAVEPAGAEPPMPGVSWEGIFGGQVFANLVVEIDFQARKIRFQDPQRFTAPDGMASLPLTLKHGHPFVQGSVVMDGGEPVPVDMVIDSGAHHALSLAVESKDDLALPSRLLDNAVLGRGLSGKISGQVGRIRTLRLGEFAFSDVITGFPPQGLNHVITSGSNGNLGSEVLRRFTATFDYAKKRLYLKPNDHYGEPFEFSTSGLGIRPWLTDGIAEIDHVYAGSVAARAGITEKDQILRVGERQVADIGVEDLRQLLRRPPGTEVRLTVRRGSEVREVELRLEKVL